MSIDWSKKLLGDVFYFYNGKAIKLGGIGQYPVYGSNGVIGGSNEFQHENTIIIGRVGAYCGSVAYCKSKFWASDNTIIAKPQPDVLDVRFSYYLLKTKNLNFFAGGSAQPLMTQNVLKGIPVNLPPLPIQRKIADIISIYDDLIENNSRRIQILEEMAQRIYREWFVHFRYTGHEKQKMVKSDLGLIPEGWEVRKLGVIVTFQKGKKPKNIFNSEKEGSMPYLLIDGLKSGINLYTNDEGMRIAEIDDVIMVMDGASSGMVYIGHYGAVGSTLAYVRPNNKNVLSPFFLYHFFKANFKTISDNNIGSAIPHANKAYMNQMSLVLSPKKLTEDFHSISQSFYLLIKTLKEKNSSLRKTRDLLLPKLISGKIDVSELDIDIGEGR